VPLFSHVIMLKLTDDAVMHLGEANNRLLEVIEQLNSTAEASVTTAGISALSGTYDYIIFLDATPYGALVAAAALGEAGPAHTQSLSCLDPEGINEVVAVLPLIRKTGPFAPYTPHPEG
jgi:uncharacterized protein with GYD domain